MNHYVTGAMIRRLREEKRLTQAELASKLCVSDKSVSKWETGRGLPDITLLQPLSAALGISVLELLSGEDITNTNRSGNMLRQKWYVCPLCGNVINSSGEAVVSCCGITLPPLEAEEPDEDHLLCPERSEDEYYVTSAHPMTREHHLSFLAAVSDQGTELLRLYPEEDAAGRFKIARTKVLLCFCNRHGLFSLRVQ